MMEKELGGSVRRRLETPRLGEDASPYRGFRAFLAGRSCLPAARKVSLSRDGGFTLIEMLVVIGIIAILAGILLPAMGRAKRAALEAQARTEISSIVAASKAFFNEYGKWPCTKNGQVDDVTYGGKSDAGAEPQNEVIDILRAVDQNNNPRKIVFLEVADKALAGTDRTGNSYTKSEGYFLDPWENPYVISFDTDFNNETKLKVIGVNVKLQGQSVAAWSYGADPTDANSFLKSWE